MIRPMQLQTPVHYRLSTASANIENTLIHGSDAAIARGSSPYRKPRCLCPYVSCFLGFVNSAYGSEGDAIWHFLRRGISTFQKFAVNPSDYKVNVCDGAGRPIAPSINFERNWSFLVFRQTVPFQMLVVTDPSDPTKEFGVEDICFDQRKNFIDKDLQCTPLVGINIEPQIIANVVAFNTSAGHRLHQDLPTKEDRCGRAVPALVHMVASFNHQSGSSFKGNPAGRIMIDAAGLNFCRLWIASQVSFNAEFLKNDFRGTILIWGLPKNVDIDVFHPRAPLEVSAIVDAINISSSLRVLADSSPAKLKLAIDNFADQVYADTASRFNINVDQLRIQAFKKMNVPSLHYWLFF